MRESVFGAILRDAVQETPGAVGGAFAASDGETVDSFTEWEHSDWAILTAHYGIVLSHIQSYLHTFHYGDAELLTFSHTKLDVLVRPVTEGYFALMAIEPPSPLARAMATIAQASARLRQEMML